MRVNPRVEEIIVSIKDKLLDVVENSNMSKVMKAALLEGHLWL